MRCKQFLLAILLVSLGGWSACAQPVTKPNVLIILSDDQGFCELGAYMDFASRENLGNKFSEEHRAIKQATAKSAPVEVCFEAARKCTPTIDAMAKRGVRFTDFHSAPTCSPARAALMSGRYPQGFGVYSNDDVIEGGGDGILPEVNFPVKLFKDAGYMTGLCGKWHLGMNKPGQHPNDRGFDYFFGFDRAHTEKYNSKILYRNRENTPAVGWLADQISSEAVDFLQRADKGKRPFFLYVAYNEPHGPTPRPPQPYIDHFKSGSDVVDVHFATIYGMDQGIGRIVAELERSGQLANTLILYGSDNGLWHFKGFNPQDGSYIVPVPGNGPFRGGKWTPWEGGVRVPFIACLPQGAVKSSPALVSIMDVMPTALDYAGIRIPDDYKLNGVSFLSVLNGQSEGDVSRTLFWAADANAPYPDPEWNPIYQKLEESTALAAKLRQIPRSERNLPCWYVRTPKWKLMGWDQVEPALIDMEKDPFERVDVAKKHPEIVAELRRQFDAWILAQKPPRIYSREQWQKILPQKK